MKSQISPAFPQFNAPFAGDDDRLLHAFVDDLSFTERQDAAIDQRASRMIEAIRDNSGSMGGVEDFLREYGLSTREGLALMVLAEALLRVPDALTQDKLIEDKLKEVAGASMRRGATAGSCRPPPGRLAFPPVFCALATRRKA